VDERRGLALLRRPGGDAEIVPAALFGSPEPAAEGYEELWRHYHRTINNESRNNPALQRRFMPKRYWKYLPELR
jgi:probable DNA metabolism protein